MPEVLTITRPEDADVAMLEQLLETTPADEGWNEEVAVPADLSTIEADEYPFRATPDQIDDYNRCVEQAKKQLLYSLSRKFGHQQADDILQEGLTRTYLKWNMFEGDEEKRGAWMHTIVMRTGLNMVKVENERQRIVPMTSFETAESDVAETPDSEPPVEERALNRIEFQRVCQAISTLPEIYRDVLLAVGVEAMSYPEYAASRNIKSTGPRLLRARAQLAEVLSESEAEPTLAEL